MVTVTKVNLPERTRARFEEENNLQRVQKPHDIRSAIPLVDYTNPAKFPPYVFREFPKMPLLDGNRPIVIDESGGVLVFYSSEDEVEFLDMNPEIADEIERNRPEVAISSTIAAQQDEIESLRAKLRAAGIETDEPKKRSGNAVLAAMRPKVAAASSEQTESPPAGEDSGLREQLKAAEADTPAPTPKKPPGNPLKKKN